MIIGIDQYKVKELKPFSIAWLFPSMNIISDPAFRLRRYLIHRYLENLKYLVSESTVIVGGHKNYNGTGYHCDDTENFIEYLKRYDIVVIFDLEVEDKDIFIGLSGSKTKCIFDHSEYIFSLPNEDDIMRNAAGISCCSSLLSQYTDGHLAAINSWHVPVFTIYDPVDTGTKYSKLPTYDQSNKACLLGANIQPYSDFLLEICDEAGYKFTSIYKTNFDKRFECLEYTPYSWIGDLTSCDVALCYHDIKKFPAKSNVKVSTAMSLGMPVIACPLTSYIEAIEHGKNGFIAETKEDWVKYLRMLKDPKLRQYIGINAKVASFQKYGIHTIGTAYVKMIQKVLEG